MSEISMNTVENIDEVEQISLLTTCTTRLHRSYRVTLHFLEIHQNISEISTPLLDRFKSKLHIYCKRVTLMNILRLTTSSQQIHLMG